MKWTDQGGDSKLGTLNHTLQTVFNLNNNNKYLFPNRGI